MAAEAFLISPDGARTFYSDTALRDALVEGNKRASKFTKTQADKFVKHWVVVEQKANTSTGFSGTLFKCIVADPDTGAEKDELVMCMRSTEFLDDAARDNLATNTMEIKKTGFAWGQIADMQQWYQEKRGSIGSKKFSVTGYSLGGHLATVFNIMNPGKTDRVVTFNGAGVGKLTDSSMAEALSIFTTRRNNDLLIERSFVTPEAAAAFRDTYDKLKLKSDDFDINDAIASVVAIKLISLTSSAAQNELTAIITALSEMKQLQRTVDTVSLIQPGKPGVLSPAKVDHALVEGEAYEYRMAVYFASKHSVAASTWAGLQQAYSSKAYLPKTFANQFDVVGDSMPSVVSNSQWHAGADVRVYIEDQPTYRGGILASTVARSSVSLSIELLADGFATKDFGDTHSLVLLADSLNTQNSLLSLLPFAQRASTGATLRQIMSGASNLQKVDGAAFSGDQGRADGAVLENVVNGLGVMTLGHGAFEQLRGSPYGNTWAEMDDSAGPDGVIYHGRKTFHALLYDVTNSAQYQGLANDSTLQLVSPPSDWTISRKQFGAFLSLEYLTPFAILGNEASITTLIGSNSELGGKWKLDRDMSALDRAAGKDTFTDQYLASRASFVMRRQNFNQRNREYDVILGPQMAENIYDVQNTVWSDLTSATKLKQVVETQYTTYVTFGSIDNENLTGGALNDTLFGGGGNDSIVGGEHNDYLEGNDGDDVLSGGKDNDFLRGGAGNDRYNFVNGDGSDTILDADLSGSIYINGKLAIGGKPLAEGAQTWKTEDDSIKYTLVDRGNDIKDLLITYGNKEKPDVILLKNYTKNKFGINLQEAEVAPPVDAPTGGNFEQEDKKYVYDGREINYTFYDGSGGTLTVSGPAAIHAGTEDTKIIGTALNESIFGADGNNIIVGNGGHDFFQLGDGNNRIFAKGEMEHKAAVEAGKVKPVDKPNNFMGAFIAVGNGDNTIVGGSEGDVMILGNGSNLVIAGSGDTLVIGGEKFTEFVGVNSFLLTHQVPMPSGGATWGAWRTGHANITHNWHNVTTGDFIKPEGYRGSLSSTDMLPHGLGDATIIGGAGNDMFSLSNGDNYVDGGAGNDLISIGVGRNTILAGTGNDTIWGSGGRGYINAEAGDDFIVLFGGQHTVFGGSGNDTIYSGHGGEDWADSYKTDSTNVIYDESGSNSIYGSGGTDSIFGGSGNDTLYAGNGVQYLKAGSGNTWIIGGNGKDTLVAGSGKDTIKAGKAETVIYGGTGSAEIQGGEGETTIYAGSGEDSIQAGSGKTTIYGGTGKTHVWGGSGTNVIYGGIGNDTILAGSGDTTIYGGSGVEKIRGGSGKNVIYAGDGGDANNPSVIEAGSGPTTIYGGSGYSQLIGSGSTTFILDEGDNSTIFNSGGSKIELSNQAGIEGMGMRGELYADGSSALIISNSTRGRAVLVGGFDNGPNHFMVGGTQLGFAQMMKQTYAEAQKLSGDGFSLSIGVDDGERMEAGDGNDTIVGAGANNTLVGGSNNSTLRGGGGGATYIVMSKTGTTTISGSDPTDKVVLGAGIRAWDLVTTSVPGHGGVDVFTIALRTGGKVKVNGAIGSMLGLVTFEDGGTTTMADLVAQTNGGVGITTYPDGSTRASSNDGLGNMKVTEFDSQHVKLGDTWRKADGSSGSTTFNADGSFVATSVFIDGTMAIRRDDGVGTMGTTTYDAQGSRVGASWTKADGTSGSDVYGAAGAMSGVIRRPDGSYSTYIADGHGNTNTLDFNSSGVQIGNSTTFADGVSRSVADEAGGKTVSTYKDAQGVLLSERWTKVDGSYGSDSFRSDGSSSGVAYKSDGSYTTYADDGRGHVVAKNFSWQGTLSGTSAAQTFGLNNTITTIMNAAGTKVSESWVHSDGSTGSNYVGGAHMYGSVAMGAMNWGGQELRDYWRTDAPNTTQTPYWADVYRKNYSHPAYGNFAGYDTTVDAPGKSSRLYYFSDTGNKNFDLSFQNYDLGLQFEIYKYDTGPVELIGNHAFLSNIDPNVPMTVTLAGKHGTSGTLKLDGKGNALMLISDAGGKMLQTMWIQNDGTYGFDLYNADGSRAGLASTPQGKVVTYTDNGSGFSAVSTQPLARRSIDLPPPMVEVPGAPGALGNMTYSGGGGGGFGDGGVYNITQYPDGSIRVVRTKDSALSYFVIRTDPGYDAGVVIDGKTTFWSYTDAGIPVYSQNEDDNGVVTTYHYNPQGRTTHFTTAVTDAGGTIAARIFDTAGTQTGTSTTTGTGTGLVTTTTYDLQGVVTGSTTRQTDGKGNSIDSVFDAAGKLSSMINVEVTAANAGTISFYDGNLNATGVITTVVDATGLVQTHNYDGQGAYYGSVIASRDGEGKYITANYDAGGKLSSYVLVGNDANGNAAFRVYGPDGMPRNASTLDAAGVETYTIFGGDGSSERFTRQPDNSFTITASDGRGNETISSYTAREVKLGDVWKSADGSTGANTFHPDGSVSGTVAYLDGATALVAKDGKGGITTNHYDANGVPAGSTVTTAAQGNVMTISYAVDGSKLSDHWTRADGSFGSDVFHADGTITGSTSKANGTQSNYVNDGKGNITTTELDRDGVVTGTVVHTPNRAPALVHPVLSQSIDEAQAFSLVIAADTFADPDSGDTLVYTVAMGDGGALPSWLSFNADTGTLSGTPADADAGVLALKVTATDRAGLTVSSAFALTVNNVNVAPLPVLPIADQYVDEASPFNFVLPAGLFADADRDDMMSYELTLADGQPLPGWITFDALSGTLSGTPGDADSGTLAIKVTATDRGELSASTTFMLVVNNVNQAPVSASPVAAQAAAQGKPFSLVIPNDAFIDPDAGDRLRYTVSAADGSPLPAWLVFDAATRKLSGTPASADVGTLAIKLTATDVAGLSVSASFQLVVMHSPHLVFTGTAGADVLKGGTGHDELRGLDGNDQLQGLAGNDTLLGGLGNDTYLIDDAGDVIVERSGEGTDTVRSMVSRVLEANVENAILMGAAAINATGNALNNALTGNRAANTLSGGGGNDTLNGGSGTDTLIGGTGDDTFVVDSADDVVIEHAGEGTDTVRSTLSYTLGADLENLVLIVSAAIDGTGNALNNVMTGNTGNNVLSGGAGHDNLNGGLGADTLVGGIGNDVYTINSADDVMIELAGEGIDTVNASMDFTLAANFENLTLTGTAVNGSGNELNNSLVGSAGNNVLTDGAGNDVLNGGLGADTLIGGIGNDVYLVDDAGDVVIEALDEGTELVKASVSHTLAEHVENLTLTGTGAINGTGNALNNTIIGNGAANRIAGGAGDDALNGGAGADTMEGGSGNDRYDVDNSADVIIENPGEGIDTVMASASFALGANLDNLTLTGTGSWQASGNMLDNILVSNSGNSTLIGGAGNDTLKAGLGVTSMAGGLGNDSFSVNHAGDVLFELAGEGADVVTASVSYVLPENIETLVLSKSGLTATGNSGFGTLVAHSGASTLIGGTGFAVLDGRGGNDTLTNVSGQGVLFGGGGADTITGGAQAQFFAGGKGSDIITTGASSNIIAFNRGDGIDTILASPGASNTLSLGKGISYANLSLSKSANDLVLNTGSGESICLQGWYADLASHSVTTLQVLQENSATYDPSSTNVLYDNKVETFDFGKLVEQFDQARAARPSLTSWGMMNGLLNAHLYGNDNPEVDGELAYHYAKNGSLVGLDLAPAVAIAQELGLIGAEQAAYEWNAVNRIDNAVR